MALYLHGLHQATPLLQWIHLHPHCCGPPIEARNIHSNLQHHHFPKLAKLFIVHMFSKHGVPSHVTSDRCSEFISHFFHSLGKALRMTLHFTSGYHPEGDGQTERMNQTLEQYLQIYCNYQQDN